MIIIHQITLTEDQIAAVNHGTTVPAFDAKISVQLQGSDGFKVENFKFYKETVSVDTDDLDVAFEATNLWNMSDITKKFSNTVYSSSVGDIFQKGDRYFMVNNFGFQELYFFADELN